jgi:hypothetical protein
MKKKDFIYLLEKLKGINYFFISGLAVAIYSKKKRKIGDIDIVVHERDIDKFARRVGSKVGKRFINKGIFVVEDYGFETKINNLKIEVTSGYPKKRIQKKTFDKLFDKKIKLKYLGQDVFVESIEELIVFKTFMHRKKDLADLKLLKNNQINSGFVRDFARDWGKEEKIINLLKKVGYNL